MVPDYFARSAEKEVQQNTPKEKEPSPEAVQLARGLAARKDDNFGVKMLWWLKEQVPLAEAFLVAISLHVVGFPLVWFIGWAFPWPQPPVITTIIEFDLTDWPKHAQTPKKIFDFRDPKFNP